VEVTDQVPEMAAVKLLKELLLIFMRKKKGV
jgi:hypothetical protein